MALFSYTLFFYFPGGLYEHDAPGRRYFNLPVHHAFLAVNVELLANFVRKLRERLDHEAIGVDGILWNKSLPFQSTTVSRPDSITNSFLNVNLPPKADTG